MNTNARWWAPTAARIGPDAVDVEMLAATGGNPRLDMGAALLAAHRVGDAACRAAAESPLCSEQVLVDNLIAARAKLADPMIDSVSKCVETGSYAALLVRDTLDDADEAALDLYRSAVARGVVPPVAAARVGAVYGVSKDALGKYRQLAIDPKPTPPNILTDVADRALFGFVAKLAAEEATEVEVEISKAPVAERQRVQIPGLTQDNPDTPYYDARNASGQFASLHAGLAAAAAPATLADPGLLSRLRTRHGVWGGAAPEVSDGRPSETAAIEADRGKAKPMTVAELRRKKAALRPRARAAAKPAEARADPQRADPKRADPQRTEKMRAAHKRKQGFAILDDQSKKADKDLSHPADMDRHLNANHPLLQKIAVDDAKFYRRLDNDVGFVLDASSAFELTHQLASSPDKLLRIGHVQKMNDDALPEEVYAGPDQNGESPYNALIKFKAEDAGGKVPTVERVDLDRFPDDPVRSSDERIYEKEMFAERNGDRRGQTGMVPEANGDAYVLYTGIDYDEMPLIYEIIVEGGIGRVEGTARHMQTVLDPNQAYKAPVDEDGDLQFDTVYDIENEVMRKRLYLRPVSDSEVLEAQRGISKAVAERQQVKIPGLTQDDPMTPYFDGRGAGGRFASMHAGLAAASQQPVTPQEEATSKRPKTVAELRRRKTALQARKTPRESRSKPEPRVVDRAGPDRAGPERSAGKRQLSQRGHLRVNAQAALFERMDRTLEQPAGQLRLQGDRAYKVMDSKDFKDLAHDNASFATLRHGKHSPVLEVRQANDLESLNSGNHLGRAVLPELRRKQFDVQHGLDGNNVKRVGQFANDLQSRMTLARLASEYAASGKHGMVIEQPVDEDASMMELHLHGKPEPIILIEFDESAEVNSGAYDLIHVRDTEHRDASTIDDNYTDEATHHYNMIVQHWLAVDPRDTEAKLRELSSRPDREAGS